MVINENFSFSTNEFLIMSRALSPTRGSNPCFTIASEILAYSWANFHGQQAKRHINL